MIQTAAPNDRRRLDCSLAGFAPLLLTAILAACAGASAEHRDGAPEGLVTVAAWNACAADGACPFSIDGAAAAPATEVSWYDAQLYLRWLSRKTGRAHRLPTLAEWKLRVGNVGEWLADCSPERVDEPGRSHRLVRPSLAGGPEALSPSLRLSDVGFAAVPEP